MYFAHFGSQRDVMAEARSRIMFGGGVSGIVLEQNNFHSVM